MRQLLHQRGAQASARAIADFSPVKQATDRESATLFERMANGDESAAVQLYDLHTPLLFGLAMAMVRDPADAEIVVVDAFRQAWTETQRFDCTAEPVAAWLTTITRQRALDRIRTRIASTAL